ncbi:MAG: carboxypeptidase regulatory-like domain-containing protein [Armatimonadetes bacterium]|nr:carboxypeptidase regulatory-like domain-containing protein [Armatimonadota bacterium]
MRRETLSALLALLTAVICQVRADAWAINAHIYQACIIYEDIADDGSVSIQRVIHNDDGTIATEPLCDIAVPEHLREAILQCPQEFRAGSCCADIYPDMYIGQSIIHPYIPGQYWRAIDWAKHVVREARDYDDDDWAHKRALAFAAGWLVHVGGDAIGHTWVNGYSGGAWDWGDMGIVSKHVALESYVNSRLPGAMDGSISPNLELNADPCFVRDTLMLHEDIYPALVTAGYMTFLIDYRNAFRSAENKCEDYMDDWWNALSWGVEPVEEWLEYQREGSEECLKEWAETSTNIGRDVSSGNFLPVPGRVTDWATKWTARLVLGIPQIILDVIDWLGAPIDWVMQPLQDALMDMAESIYNQLLRDTFEEIVNPEQFILATHGEEVRQKVDLEMGVTADHPEMNWPEFVPFYDSVTLGKLSLLDKAGVDQLSAAIGYPIPMADDEDNVLWECVNSMDASNQLALYPKFRLLETDEITDQVYRQLFKGDPFQAPPSAFDAAHILAYRDMNDPDLMTFILPLKDPMSDQHRAVAYVYQAHETGGAPHRVPFFEASIATHGTENRMTDPVVCSFRNETGGTVKLHFATAAPMEGSTELVEDRGVDVSYGPADWTPEDLLPGNAQVDTQAMEQFLSNLQQSMAQAAQQQGPNTQTAGMMQQQAELMAQAVQNIQQLNAQGGYQGAMAAAQQNWQSEPLVVSSQILDQTFAEAGLPMPMPPDDAPLSDEVRELLATRRNVLGTVLDETGQPVQHAAVTMVKDETLARLRSGSGIPLVPLSEWAYQVYYLGRTNEKGQFILPACTSGPHTLIASAPGQAKAQRQVDIQITDCRAIVLDPIELVPAQDASDQSGGYDTGQHRAYPDLMLTLEPRVISYDQAGKDGTVRATLTLRPLGGFAAPVVLSAEGLPPGVTARFSTNPVVADSLATVQVTFSAAKKLAGRPVQAMIRAVGGGLEREAKVILAMSSGELVTEPSSVTLRAGGKTTVRLTWKSPAEGGQAVRLTLGKAPANVWVKADTIRGHQHVPPLKLIGLTQADAEKARLALLPEVPTMERPMPTPQPIPQATLQRGPAEAPFKGILLGPDGWVDLLIAVGANVPAGTLKIPVKCELGNRVTSDTLTVTVQ